MDYQPAPVPPDHIARAYIAYSRFVAVLAIVLPLALLASSWLSSCEVRGSLSAYYHGTDFERNIFVGILCAVAVFLLLYRGWQCLEANLISLAGVMAVLVAFVPTGDEPYSCAEGFSAAASSEGFWSIHGTAALILFGCIIVVAVVLPYLKNRSRRPDEQLALQWYWLSSGTILLGAILAVLGKSLWKGTPYVFLVGEALLVLGFGWFWFLRSRNLGQKAPRQFLLDEDQS